MAGNHLCFVWQFEEARVDRIDDLLRVSPGKIGAADAAREKRVSSDEDFKWSKMQANRSLRMAWGMNHLCRVAHEAYRLSVTEAFIRESDFGCRDADPRGLLVHHLEQGKVVLIQKNGRPSKALEFEGASYMVDMGVCHENLPQLEAKFAESAMDSADLVAGVDYDRLAGSLVAEKSAVALERADGEGFKDHGSYSRLARGLHGSSRACSPRRLSSRRFYAIAGLRNVIA